MFTPDTKFSKWTAVERNHLIAALSDIIFIVEAKNPSGSLMQGKINLKFGKPTFVFDNGLPGNYNLIECGATPVTKQHIEGVVFKRGTFFSPQLTLRTSSTRSEKYGKPKWFKT